MTTPAMPRPARPDMAEPSGPVAALIAATRDLTSLIERETTLLDTHRPQDIRPLQAEKARLTAEYRRALGRIKVNPQSLGPQGSPAREQIRVVTDGFQRTLQAHARVVMRLKTVTEGIISTVGDEVAKRNRPIQNYGRDAVTAALPPAQTTTSISLNQVI